MERLNETDLIHGCLKENRKYQRELFRRFSGKMMAVCYRYARKKEDAHDILQESFIKVFDHLKDYKREGSLEGWIRKTVVNTALNYYRRMYHSFENNELGEKYENVPIMPEVMDNLDEMEIIGFISRLPDGYRMVFNLFAIEGYSHREIAEMTGIDESTSRSQLFKARAILQKMISKKNIKILV